MTANHKSAGKKEARVHTGVHACMHCRHTNQICLKCGTLKEERAPVCIKYSCDVFWGAYMCMCAGIGRKRVLANCAASTQQSSADTSSGSRREKGLGWGKKGRGRGRRRDCMCVCEIEREGGKEGHGRTAARISPIAGEGPRGGTRTGILLLLSKPSQEWRIPSNPSGCGEDSRDVQPHSADRINSMTGNSAACGTREDLDEETERGTEVLQAVF